MLREAGEPPKVVQAGLLHDVLEDTDVSPGELRERFGPEVTELVEAVTEDPSISNHRKRKEALRERVLAAGPAAARIALADKADKLTGRDGPPSERRLEHHRATLEGVEGRFGRSGLSELLRERLAPYDGAGAVREIGGSRSPGTARDSG
jgi:(p)ppGpp synthase/HD superfamily hydrolase